MTDGKGSAVNDGAGTSNTCGEAVVRDGGDPVEQPSSAGGDNHVGCYPGGAGGVPQGEGAGIIQGGQLLALQGREALSRKLSYGEFRGKKTLAERTAWREGNEPGEESRLDLPRAKVWYLPADWCCDCGKRKPCEVPGLDMLQDNAPDTGLKKGDLIRYYLCNGCFDGQVEDGLPSALEEANDREFIQDTATPLIVSAAGSQVLRSQPNLVDIHGQNIVADHRRKKWQESFTDRQARIKANARGWCRAAHINGQEPTEINA